MKFIILKNQSVHENDLLSDIAEFMWNSGHEVEINNQEQFSTNDTAAIDDYNCSISINSDDVATNILFFNHRNLLKNHVESNHQIKRYTAVIFSNRGVFTNAIPFPHQIFTYGKLDKNSLNAVFEWFKKLSLSLRS